MKTLLLAACVISGVVQPVVSQEFGQAKPAAREIDDKEAKVIVTALQQKLKAAKKNLVKRLEAVQLIGRYRNGLLVRPLLKLARTDKRQSIRKAATAAIGLQPKKAARRALLQLLKKYDIRTDPNQTASIIRAFTGESYETKDWSMFKNMFQKTLADNQCVDAQLAIIEVAGAQKERTAVRFLIQHIDGPAPAWVDNPSNPPASYWESRWKNWEKWKAPLNETLYQITGQRFGSTKEARAWAKKNRKLLKAPRKKKKQK